MDDYPEFSKGKESLEQRIDYLESHLDDLESSLEKMDDKMLTWGRLSLGIIGGIIGIIIVKLIFKFFGW